MLDWLFGRKKEQPQPDKKKKPQAQQEAEDKWKYQFIIQFLSGPLWKTSILDYVDYHCVVFDNEQQNKFQYTTIHNKFKELVGSLFDGMMQEVGLDDDKLAQLLEKGFQSKHKKIFNQLLLVDDFQKFKQLMVNRNKTLEAEAVKALHQSQGLQKPEKNKGKGKLLSEEQILRQSLRAQEERRRKIQEQQEEQLRRVLQLSKMEAQEHDMIKKLEEKVVQSDIAHQKNIDSQKQAIPQKPVVAPRKEVPKVQQPILPKQVPKVQQQPVVVPPAPVAEPQQPPVKPKKNLPSLQPLPPLKHQKKVEESPQVQWKKQGNVPSPVKVEEKAVENEKAEVESQEQRKKRLLQQRERIRKKKEQQRKKQMQEEQLKQSQVQTIVLQDDGIHETQLGAQEQKKISNAQVERRRELMKKIKNRLVDDL